MDFLATLTRISGFLNELEIRHALIGGLALTAYGGTRTTLDLDLAVDGDRQNDILRFMEGLGFETLHRSAGYSNHLHVDELWGRVDFVYVRGATRELLFGESQLYAFSADLEVRVPKPEHLAAMKVVAMKNDPSRTFQDLADIRLLLSYSETDVDAVRQFFEKHGLGERFRELRKTL